VSDLARTCASCGSPFSISADEQAFFDRLARERQDAAWRLPVRCSGCRQARRAARDDRPVTPGVHEQVLTCADCGGEFRFGGRDRAFYIERGFPTPKRCRACRRAVRSLSTQ